MDWPRSAHVAKEGGCGSIARRAPAWPEWTGRQLRQARAWAACVAMIVASTVSATEHNEGGVTVDRD
eukprot:6097550-Alexandrium_andersonii.AAC.1